MATSWPPTGRVLELDKQNYLFEVDQSELERRVLEIRKAWTDRWEGLVGPLSPQHRASFLEKPEFHELAHIPKEFGLKAINKFRHRGEILKEAKRLQKTHVQETKRKPVRSTPSRTTNRTRRRSAGRNLEGYSGWNEPRGVISEDEPLYINQINLRDFLDDEEELDHWNQNYLDDE